MIWRTHTAIGTGSLKEERMYIVEGRQENVERELLKDKSKLNPIKIIS